REGADHLAALDLPGNRLFGLAGKALHRPVARELAVAEQERLQHLAALRRVRDLGVKLQPIDGLEVVRRRRERRARRARDRREAGVSTEAGPPERTMPRGLKARMSLAARSGRWISQ